MELHCECRGRWFKSNRIERCVAQSGRARMFHQHLVADFHLTKRMPNMTTTLEMLNVIFKNLSLLIQLRITNYKLRIFVIISLIRNS